VVADWNNRSRV